MCLCGSITPNENSTNSLDFNVGIHEEHSTLPGKYEFSFTIACKYLNSGKSRKRPPESSPSPSTNDTPFLSRFGFCSAKMVKVTAVRVCVCVCVDTGRPNGFKANRRKGSTFISFFFCPKLNSVPTSNANVTTKKETKAQDDGDGVKVNRKFRAYGVAMIMVTDDMDGGHKEKKTDKTLEHMMQTHRVGRV